MQTDCIIFSLSSFSPLLATRCQIFCWWKCIFYSRIFIQMNVNEEKTCANEFEFSWIFSVLLICFVVIHLHLDQNKWRAKKRHRRLINCKCIAYFGYCFGICAFGKIDKNRPKLRSEGNKFWNFFCRFRCWRASNESFLVLHVRICRQSNKNMIFYKLWNIHDAPRGIRFRNCFVLIFIFPEDVINSFFEVIIQIDCRADRSIPFFNFRKTKIFSFPFILIHVHLGTSSLFVETMKMSKKSKMTTFQNKYFHKYSVYASNSEWIFIVSLFGVCFCLRWANKYFASSESLLFSYRFAFSIFRLVSTFGIGIVADGCLFSSYCYRHGDSLTVSLHYRHLTMDFDCVRHANDRSSKYDLNFLVPCLVRRHVSP